MSIPGNANTLLLNSAAAAGGYQISRSLRFNSADSAYLSRTPASAGNRKTWTWAGWVKRSALGAQQSIFGNAAAEGLRLRFESGDTLRVLDGTNGANLIAITTEVFRDVSAWYHIVLTINTTESTGSNRAKIYINGIRQTLTYTNTPGLNLDLGVNNTGEHNISNAANQGYLSGYAADIYFIDGQALDPTSFGEFDDNGIWQPKAYTGTYGTNGFKLNFADNSTAAALGTDTSGNSNTWTVNNLSVTAGAGNDSLVDVPTNGTETDTGLGAEVRGNHCTLNPLSNGTGTAPSNGNLNLAVKAAASTRCNSTLAVSSGKWYFETTLVTAGTDAPRTAVGIGQGFLITAYPGQDANSYAYTLDFGAKYNNSVETTGYGTALSSGDIFMCAFDLENNKIFFGRNGTWFDSGNPTTGTNPAFSINSGTYCAIARPRAGAGGPIPEVAFNFGQRPFAYTAPSGFKALNTSSLPAPVITKPSEYMDVKLYTGNGGTQTISGLEFSPDLVWIKNRSQADNHKLLDTVRGATKELESNTTDAEVTNTDGLTAFNSDGFALGADVEYNTSSESYVAWTWDAGSSTATNTDGSITSQVRTNGYLSIVTYTGNGSAGATIGHGLGIAPYMVIIKRRNIADNWAVYHTSLGGGNNLLFLESADATRADLNVWNSTAPSSSLVTLGNRDEVNNNTSTYVAYCFAPVAGYSSMDSYVGNGSTDGIFVYTGFKSKFILIKKTSSGTTASWRIFDTSRDSYNTVTKKIYPNLSNAEVNDATDNLDIFANGFKLRSADNGVNASGATYIYAAFAESPFSLARAR